MQYLDQTVSLYLKTFSLTIDGIEEDVVKIEALPGEDARGGIPGYSGGGGRSDQDGYSNGTTGTKEDATKE